MNPLLPIALLLIGSGAMVTGLFLPRSRSGIVALVPIVAAVAAVFAALALGFRIPAQITVSAWPESLFDAGLTLLADRASWLYGLGILIGAAAVFLTGLARPGGPRLGPRTASLLIAAAAVAAVQSENLITLAITWAVLDAVYILTLIFLASGENIANQAVLSLTFNSAATFCVIAAALDALHTGQAVFLIGQSALTQRGVLLLLFAALFRLGVFPFHLALPSEANVNQGLGALLRLAPAAVALDLLTHILVVSPELPLKSWLTAAACLGLLVGAIQLWDSPEPRQGISYLTLAHSSLALLAALWGGASAGAGVLAIGLALALGAMALFLSNPFHESERRWAILPFAGAFVLASGPFTVGFLGMSVMYSGFLSSGAWPLLVICILGQTLLAAAYLRVALWPGEPAMKAEPIIGVAYLFGLATLLLFAVIGGLAPVGIAQAANARPIELLSSGSLTALGAVVAAMLGGAALWRFESAVRSRAQAAWTAVTSTARLGWLYGFLWDLYRLIGRALRGTAAVIEGEGGVLWALVAVLLVWLLFR